MKSIQKQASITAEAAYAGVASEQLIPRPFVQWEPQTIARCKAIYRHHVQNGTGAWLPDLLFANLPKWIFLEYVAKHCHLLLRGSNDPELTQLEALDPSMPGALPSHNIVGWNQPHIYAYSSGLCAMFFAILDRQCLSRCGAIARASTIYHPREERQDEWCEAFYFGVDYRALVAAPWQTGTVYLFSSTPFAPQYRKIVWFSGLPVRPLAKLQVAPWDWPFLEQVSGLNWQALDRRSDASPSGFPWREDPQIHPLHRHRPRMEQVRAYLERHYAENISLAILGSRAEMSPFKLLRLFRATMGCSPLQYQTRRRIVHAKRLLGQGLPIAAAAYETGFVDQAHLTHHFKRLLGITPGRYLHLQ